LEVPLPAARHHA
jgi:hypothetical protein